jgi:hypothetical protein
MDLKINLIWAPVGNAMLDDGLVRYLGIPEGPGVYAFDLRHANDRRRYIGEASDLRRRFAHYRRPGASQSTNQRMNERVKRSLAAGGSVTIEVAQDIRLTIGDKPVELDLGREFDRRLVENAAIVEALAAGLFIVNGRGYPRYPSTGVLH